MNLYAYFPYLFTKIVEASYIKIFILCYEAVRFFESLIASYARLYLGGN